MNRKTDDELYQIQGLALLTEWLKREDDDEVDGKIVEDMHKIAAVYMSNVLASHVTNIDETIASYEVNTVKDLKLCLGDVILKMMSLEMANNLGVDCE